MYRENIRVLVVTCEWPDKNHPNQAPFLVQQVNFLKNAGVNVSVFSFRGKANIVNYLKAWWKLHHSNEWKDCDVIHAHWGQSGLISLPCSVPLVITFHGSDLQGIVGSTGKYVFSGKILLLISQFVAKFATEIIVVSKSLLKYLPKGLQAHVIPGGVDFKKFFPIPQEIARARLRLSTGKIFVLFAANPLDPVKRFGLAYAAVDLLKKNYDIELLNIYNIEHQLVSVYMNACDVLLLTSHHEGSPTIVKEALTCKLPIVSVNVGDVRERIEPIQGCWVCPDDNEKTIARCLENVIRNPSRLRLDNDIEALDENIAVKKIISIYQSVLSQ